MKGRNSIRKDKRIGEIVEKRKVEGVSVDDLLIDEGGGGTSIKKDIKLMIVDKGGDEDKGRM